MLIRILVLYAQSLVTTTILVALFSGAWLGLRALRKTDKTLKERQASLYDALLIGVMVIPILSFAMMGMILMLRI